MDVLWSVYRNQDAPCTADTNCDDGRACNGLETCDQLSGICVNGSEPSTPPSTVVEITITTDLYPQEIYWIIVNECTGVHVREGRYFQRGTYISKVCFDDTSDTIQFTFTMGDRYGDGMCCSLGHGGYSVLYHDEIGASGGSFKAVETTTFGTCTETSPPTTTPSNCKICKNDSVSCCPFKSCSKVRIKNCI